MVHHSANRTGRQIMLQMIIVKMLGQILEYKKLKRSIKLHLDPNRRIINHIGIFMDAQNMKQEIK